MKRLYFGFVFFLFSSLFILNGCYTALYIQERESMYESVVPDSNTIGVNISQIEFYPFFSPYRFQFRYFYPQWYYEPYWYGQWRPYYFYRFRWDGHRFGYWDNWYRYPTPQNNWWQKNSFPKYKEKIIIPRTRNNSGERGIYRDEPRSPKTKDVVRPQEKTKDSPRGRTDGDRVRSRDEIKKDTSPQVIPREKNINTERKRGEPTRAPQTNSEKEKSSNKNPTKSNTTRDRGRG